MMKSTIIVIFSAILLLLSGNWIEIEENSKIPVFSDISKSDNEIEIKFSLSGYEIKSVIENGIEYQRISCRNEGEFLQVGKPDLPRFTRLASIHNEGEVSVEIISISQEFLSDIITYPKQELQLENRHRNSNFRIDEEFYSGTEIFPSEILKTGIPAIMRDIRVVNVTVNPFQYDPQKKELRIIKNLEFKINCKGTKGENIKSADHQRSRFFEQFYSSTIINYSPFPSRDTDFQNPSYLFIYPDNEQVESYLQDLFNWKHQKGFTVFTANTSETGANLNSIKSYIQDAYDNWENPPEFICLVGDAGGSFNIPTGHIDGGEGDHFYTLLEGNDILSDAFIGRLSFNSYLQLQTIINKILEYEKEPYLDDPDWFDRALLVGDGTHSGPSCISTKQSIKFMIDENNPNIVSNEVYNGNWVNQITNNINEGVAFFNYRGWGDLSGWNTSYTNSLNNNHLLPFVTFITCNTGDFEGNGSSISEGFLRAGNPDEPTGAIGAISTATGQTHTCFNNCIDAGIYHGIFVDRIYHMGGALNRGKLALYNNYPENQYNNAEQFAYWNNLMGDPGLELWTGIPQNLEVIHNTPVPVGSDNLEVSIYDEMGNPVQDAWVTVLKGEDEIFATGFTDENGEVLLEINAVIAGDVDITVTKHDFKPHLGRFSIIQADVFIRSDEFTIDDDNSGSSSGNNDGFLNPGENIELNVSLQNYGTSNVNSVTASLTTGSEFITIIDEFENYGNIESGSSQFSSDDFDFFVNDNAIGGAEVVLELSISDSDNNRWNDLLYLTIEGPNLYVLEQEIINANNYLDAGETAELVLTLQNIGSMDIENVSAELISPDSLIIIDDANADFGNISATGTADNDSDRFVLTASNQIISGTQFQIELHLTSPSGYDANARFILQVGEIGSNDPLGPDQYGYYCYDESDVEYIGIPEYNWIEIDPDLGGVGNTIFLFDPGDTGSKQIIPLPIDFKFYGEIYNEITVCSNGWICPGSTNLSSFMNRYIPGPLGPSPMIAPFWDDLRTGDGNVSFYHDQDDHKFIVEWSNMQNDFDESEETFQVILYDHNFYPSSTGDSPILFQYKTFNDVDMGTYGTMYVHHGEYSTVGIEDHTGSRGLQYLFSNNYATGANTLHDETAILFTGVLPKYEGPFLILENVILDDENGNGNADYSENIDVFIELRNVGSEVATGITAAISSQDEFIIINSANTQFDDIGSLQSGISLDPIEITVADNCPNSHNAEMELNIQSGSESWIYDFQIELNAPSPQITEQYFDDNNNDFIDPGETVDFLITITNHGGADLFSSIMNISTIDPYITINVPESALGDVPADSSATAIFTITADESSEVGYVANIDWEITGNFGYSEQGQTEISITQTQFYVEEHFLQYPPAGWTIVGDNWRQINGSNAGGSAPEAQFYWFPYNNETQRIISPIINSTGSSTIELQFTHSVLDLLSNYSQIKIETSSNGINWNTVNSWFDENISPVTENFIIDNPDVGSPDFRIAWTFEGNSDYINSWFIDDIIINPGENQMMGFIAGNVELTGGLGDVQDVALTIDELTVNPDENGEYLFSLTPGIYDLSIFLDNYEASEINNIEVDLFQTTVLDFILNYMQPPDSLLAIVTENDVELNWRKPVFEERSRKDQKVKRISKNNIPTFDLGRSRDFTGYNIYRNNDLIYSINDINDTTFTDFDLPNGQFEYFLTAVYDGGESLPSNTEVVMIDVENSENNDLPIRTILQEIFPNPFVNLDRNVTINYSLSVTSEVVLEVYNLKGQKVKTLMNETFEPGFYQQEWNFRDNEQRKISSGIYLLRMKTKDYQSIKKMVIIQ